MNISEPSTMLTDYLLAAVSLTFAVRLYLKGQSESSASIKLWAGVFAATGVGGIFGGTYHGFAPAIGADLAGIIWKVTVYCIGFTGFFMISGSAYACFSGTFKKTLLAVAAVKFMVYSAWMATHDDFYFVIFDYTISLVGILILHMTAGNHGEKWWIFAGVLGSFFAAGIQLSGFTIHQHFNHNDLFHVIQMFVLYLLYRGAALLQDTSKTN